MDNIMAIAQMLSEELAQELQAEAKMSAVERKVRRLLQEIGRQAVTTYIQAQEAAYPASETACPHCEQQAKYVRRRPTQLWTMFGRLSVKRAYYLCAACSRGHYPLDRRLGLRPNALSAELERLAAMTGVALPFGKGQQLFADLTLVSLSDQTLAKAAQAYGRAVEQQEQAWTATAEDEDALLLQQRTAQRPLRLYGAIDATKVHTRDGAEHPWRDLKVGAWFVARGQPPRSPAGQWRIQAEDITYFTDIGPAAEFGSLLWATGVQRQAQLARELVFLGDGADWIWQLVAEHFPQAVQILDWFHATEYLTPAAKTHLATEDDQEVWVARMKQALWDGQLDHVIDTCRQLARTADSNDPAWVAARYFDRNRRRMAYPLFRKQGYQIGSGTIESAAKQIGTLRMKVAGAIWNEDSARKVAKARAAYLSDQWDDLAAIRELPLAI